jgi:hypothetical protein
MRKQQQKHIEMENEFQAYPSVRTRKHGRRTSKWRKRGTNFVGMLFLFVTFTQIGTGGAMVFLTRYLPLMIVLLALLAALEGRFNPRASSVFLILFGVMFISNISVSSLQYIIVILAYLIIISTLQSKRLPEKITDYAFYAMILNIVIYASEVILIGGLGISFDPTIFNYIGAGRDEVISTWGFSRFAAHHTEPGSFAANLGGLTVLSLLGSRKPTFFHWLSVLSLVSTLSISAAAISAITIMTILVAGRFRLKTIATFVVALALGAYALLNVLPMVGVNTVDFMLYRLQERGGTDGSILVKQLLIDELMNRGGWTSLLGNRHGFCSFCRYSKSLGFGFYMLFEGGLLGAVGIVALFVVAGYRHGLRGIAMVGTLSLMRIEFFFPQAIIIIFAISELPRVVRRQIKHSTAELCDPIFLKPSTT